jgi:phosphate transport system substrate-binding protein
MSMWTAVFVAWLWTGLASGLQAATTVIPGAGPPEIGLKALAAEFMRQRPGTVIEVPPSIGIAGGLRALQSGEASIARLARRLTDEELRSGGLQQVVYGADAVVFVTGRDVPVTNLTEAQALALFSGSTDDWEALGGPPAPVLVFYREATEIAHQALRRHIPAFAQVKFTASAKLANSDTEMRNGLARYRTALGWMTLSTSGIGDDTIRALNFNGVPASADTVASGRYPMKVEHVLVYKESQLGDELRRFLGFVTSPEGAQVLRRLQIAVPRSPASASASPGTAPK